MKHCFASEDVGAGVGLVLIAAGTFLLWDTYGRRGHRTPRVVRVAAGIVSSWW